jgi:protein arginine N-methyltransferase 1
MYSFVGYGRMVADRVRMDAYARAMRQVVFPGAVVLDIGTGTGIHAMLACQMGARRVYAVEPDRIIQVAREAAAANGFADRIQFIQDLSSHVSLPERADVVVCDLRGVLPLFGHNLPAVADARDRLLAEGGSLIPLRDTVHGAVVESPEVYARYSGPWDTRPYGLDFAAARRVTTNSWGKEVLDAEALLTSAVRWTVIDYRTVRDPNVAGPLRWTVERGGTGHGVVLWFDAELAEGAAFSNAPGPAPLIYGGAFFPWEEAVALRAGDEVAVEMRADLVEDEYVWSWATEVRRAGGTRTAFRQSTFVGSIAGVESLRRSAHDHVPALAGEGEAVREALARMDGATPLAEVARHLHARFPHRFADWRAAMGVVAELSRRYGA